MTRLQKGSIGALLTGALLGIALVAVVFGGEAALSTEEFCTSCHSMSYPQAELKESTHYGALGVNPTCKDCHIPQGIENFHLAVATHVVDGARELWLEMVNDYSTLEKFNERRLEMAHDARMNLKKWDSITCRTCHVKPAPPGESAQAEHRKMETEGATCIDCHQNLVHEEVPMTDLNASLAQGKLVLKPEEGDGDDGDDDADDADDADDDEEEVEVEVDVEETEDAASDSDSDVDSNNDDDDE